MLGPGQFGFTSYGPINAKNPEAFTNLTIRGINPTSTQIVPGNILGISTGLGPAFEFEPVYEPLNFTPWPVDVTIADLGIDSAEGFCPPSDWSTAQGTITPGICTTHSTGGAILNNGATVHLLNDDFDSDGFFAAPGSAEVGAAIANLAGSITVADSSFENSLDNSGGATITNSGQMNISDSTIADNPDTAVVNQASSATLTVSDSTIANNEADGIFKF